MSYEGKDYRHKYNKLIGEEFITSDSRIINLMFNFFEINYLTFKYRPIKKKYVIGTKRGEKKLN